VSGFLAAAGAIWFLGAVICLALAAIGLIGDRTALGLSYHSPEERRATLRTALRRFPLAVVWPLVALTYLGRALWIAYGPTPDH